MNTPVRRHLHNGVRRLYECLSGGCMCHWTGTLCFTAPNEQVMEYRDAS